MIFAINKIDLVSDDNLKAWKKYYKQAKLLTVGFKSNEFLQKYTQKDEDEDMEEDDKPQTPQEKAKQQLMGYLFKYAKAFMEKK